MKSDFTTAPHALAPDKGAASGAMEKSTRALHTKNLISPATLNQSHSVSRAFHDKPFAEQQFSCPFISIPGKK